MDNKLNRDINCSEIIPVSDSEFNFLLSSIMKPEIGHVSVAVSGGSDSLALAWLLNRWCTKFGITLTALTVDHQLRENSKEEALRVSSWLKAWGIMHVVLPWRGKKRATRIQELARIARYNLMLGWCLDNNVKYLFLGHHQEDQAETFLLRAAMGSGTDGLACMRAETISKGVHLIRPLLHVPRQRLKETLMAISQEWLEDPTNSDPAFDRTVMRKLSKDLDCYGVGPGKLASVADKFGQLRFHLEELTLLAIKRGVSLHPTGWAELGKSFFVGLPDEIAKRVLINILKCIGGLPYPPRSLRLERAIRHIKSNEAFSTITLAGCIIRQSKDEIVIFREVGRSPSYVPVLNSGEQVWQGVFKCRNELAQGPFVGSLFLGALGERGWNQLVQVEPKIKSRKIHYSVAITLPTLFDDCGVLEVPHLMYNRNNTCWADPAPGQRILHVSFISLHDR